MMGMALMRGTLSAIGVLFGGLGMFFPLHSFTQPIMAVCALVFLNLGDRRDAEIALLPAAADGFRRSFQHLSFALRPALIVQQRGV